MNLHFKKIFCWKKRMSFKKKGLAICLHGKLGGIKGPNDTPSSAFLKTISSSWNHNVILPNFYRNFEVELFIHSWNKGIGSDLIDEFFDPTLSAHDAIFIKNKVLSRHFSLLKVLNLSRSFVQTQPTLVFVSRMDLVFYNSIFMDQFDLKRLYFPQMCMQDFEHKTLCRGGQVMTHYHVRRNGGSKYRGLKNGHTVFLSDHFFISNFSVALRFESIIKEYTSFERLKTKFPNWDHFFWPLLVEKERLEKQVDFRLMLGLNYSIARWKFRMIETEDSRPLVSSKADFSSRAWMRHQCPNRFVSREKVLCPP